MRDLLAQSWWLLTIRGVAAIAFGLMCFVWPSLTLLVLITLFGAYALIDGIVLLVALARGGAGARGNGWSLGLSGILGVAAGLIAVFWPGLTAVSLALVVGAWAVTIGVFQIIAAIRLRQEIEGELWMALAGVLAILFGLYIVVLPGEGLISLLWLVGSWAIFFGVITLVLAWRLRAFAHPAKVAMRP